MLGQSKLLKMAKENRNCLLLSQLEKEKLLQTCLCLPGGGFFVLFVGGCGGVLCVVFCLFLNLQQERQALDNNLEAILQGSSFVCAKGFGMLMWYTGIDCTGK